MKLLLGQRVIRASWNSVSIAVATSLHTPFSEAVARTRRALAEQNFGVLTEVDMKATLKKKLDTRHGGLPDPRRLQSPTGPEGRGTGHRLKQGKGETHYPIETLDGITDPPAVVIEAIGN